VVELQNVLNTPRMYINDRRRCKVEQVVPCGAANIVNCNGLSNNVTDDDDDDDVICLDDEPPVKKSNSQHSAGFVESHFSSVQLDAFPLLQLACHKRAVTDN